MAAITCSAIPAAALNVRHGDAALDDGRQRFRSIPAEIDWIAQTRGRGTSSGKLEAVEHVASAASRARSAGHRPAQRHAGSAAQGGGIASGTPIRTSFRVIDGRSPRDAVRAGLSARRRCPSCP
jgi:hypothetical protein